MQDFAPIFICKRCFNFLLHCLPCVHFLSRTRTNLRLLMFLQDSEWQGKEQAFQYSSVKQLRVIKAACHFDICTFFIVGDVVECLVFDFSCFCDGERNHFFGLRGITGQLFTAEFLTSTAEENH